MDLEIKDGYRGNCVEVDDNSHLLVKGVSDLIATLTHIKAIGPVSIRMKDMTTGEMFAISYLGKDKD
jgi:hypothetical protein